MDEITRAITEAFPQHSDFVVLTRDDFDFIKSHLDVPAQESRRLAAIQMVPLVLDVPEDGVVD